MDTLARWLEDGTRLVTITGAAGVGKTRLALRLSRRSAQIATVAFCDLSEARDAPEMTTLVARSLGVPMTNDRASADQLGRAIRARGRSIIVLDNFEQLDERCDRILEGWLEAAPEAAFVVTSRRRLRLPAERCFELEPLDTPARGDSEPSRLARFPSVQLFVQRAETAGADLGSDDLPLVAAIVRELDGIPLAIELAAARSCMLSVAEIHEMLGDRFALLRDRGRRVDRQLTLRGALDWSWSLLSDSARDALAQCATFRGGWDLEAARNVLDLGGEPILEVLEDLHDQSLLTIDTSDGARRFRLYASVRAYAAGQLEDDEGAVAKRHARHYAGTARRLSRSIFGSEGEAAFEALMREVDNIVAAVEHLREEGDEAALDALVALAPVYERHGPLDVFLERLDTTLSAVGEVGPALRARALVAKGIALEASGDASAAVDVLRLGLAHAQDAGEPPVIAEAAVALAWACGIRGDYGDADAAFAHAEETLRDPSCDAWLRAHAMQKRGYLSYRRGNRAHAERDMQRAVALFRELGARRDEASAIGWLGFVADGRPERAVPYFRRSVAMLEELGDVRHLGRHLQYLAVFEIELGHLDDSEAHFLRSLELHRRAGDRQQAAVSLSRFAALDLERGRAEAALDKVSEALRNLDSESDLLYRGEALGFASAASAELGMVEEARRQLAAARAILEPLRYPSLDALGLLEARCDVAEAVLSSGDAAALLRRRALERVGAEADFSYAFTRLIHRLLSRSLGARAELPTRAALQVAADFSWFEPSGAARVTLTRRAAMRRILEALVVGAERGHVPVTVAELVEAGWPGQAFIAASGEARVYTTVRRLRKLGLGELLHHDGAGYRLVCGVRRLGAP